MTMFQFENLNEKLFNRVVCFAYSYPSGLGGPGTLLMYTEDGEEYLADQRGLVEYDWFKLDEIVPFRDESRFKEYYWGIGVYLYIRNDLYDKVISAMERIEKHYRMMPTVNKVIWPLLEAPEEKVIRIVYAGSEKIIEREKKKREEKERAYEKIRLTENDMKWNDLYILFESAKDRYKPEGCYTTLYRRNENGSITGSIWSILYQQDGQLSFDEESGKWGMGIEVYNIFYNQYSNLSEPLSYPPPDGGDEPVTFFNPGRFFCSCQTLEEAKKRIVDRNNAIGWGCYTKKDIIVPTEKDWKF